MKIAIIGTGIAAATLAHRLRGTLGDGKLQLFEKSRGTGGRMSTRRRQNWAFDHGAPFFTARTQSFQQFLQPFQLSGVVAEWQPRALTLAPGQKPYRRDWFEPHYVAAPTMSALCKTLLTDTPVYFEQTISGLSGNPGRWYLESQEGGKFGPFDWVVSTAPSEQTHTIFSNVANTPVAAYDPCFTLMIGVPTEAQTSKPFDFDIARVNHSIINWLSWSNRKPGRDASPSLVAHATGDYSRNRFDSDQETVQLELIDALKKLMPGSNLPSSKPSEAKTSESMFLHRWKYAQVREPVGTPFWTDPVAKLAACGDWFLGNEVEHAYTSADALSAYLAAA